MRLLLTFGPSYEPIDEARRLTNMSSGRLGTDLANAFCQADWEVHCLRGEGASHRGRLCPTTVETFTTNDDLASRLEVLSRSTSFDAVFHAAALCDFRVARTTNALGQPIRSNKISTRDGRLVLELEPAAKVLPRLRQWFPSSRLVGWKYELEGSRDQAYAKAWKQVGECATDACVLNGAAYGPGFALCLADGRTVPVPDARELASALLHWLSSSRTDSAAFSPTRAWPRPRDRRRSAPFRRSPEPTRSSAPGSRPLVPSRRFASSES